MNGNLIRGAHGLTVDELLAFHRAHFGDARMENEAGAEQTDPARLNLPQTIARMGEYQAEIERLGTQDTLSEADSRYFDELNETFFALDAHRQRLERSDALARVRSAAQGLEGRRLVPGAQASSTSSRSSYDRDPMADPRDVTHARGGRNPWDLSEVRTFGRPASELRTELMERARDCIEQMSGATDTVREGATSILERWNNRDSNVARFILATSSPTYMSAWAKAMRGAAMTLTPQEAAALEEARAMSLTDNQGGYLVPFQLDPTVIITSNGSFNQIRNAARQVVATGDKWDGVSAAAVSWSFDAEGAEVSDDAPTFAQPEIAIHMARGFVPISIEAHMDEQNVTGEVARLLAEGKDDLESAKFALGTGTGEPWGIVSALAGTASEINAAADDTFAIGDVYTLEGALPAKHRARASWLANHSIYNLVRRFDTSGGGGFWANLGQGRPAELLGRPALEAESMDGTVTTVGVTSNLIMVYGNFQHYVIADRLGMTVELIPHLFHTANNRPSGQRGWFAYYRTGADSVNDGAFRLLDVPSAA